MSKISLIIRREYLTRVRKRSFIIMTLLTPFLMAGIALVPMLLTFMDQDEQKVMVVTGNTRPFEGKVNNSKSLQYLFFPNFNQDQAREFCQENEYFGVLHIPDTLYVNGPLFHLISEKPLPIDEQNLLKHAFAEQIERQQRTRLLKHWQDSLLVDVPDSIVSQNFMIDSLDAQLSSLQAAPRLQTRQWSDDGDTHESSTILMMVIGFISAFLIYSFVFTYSAQVMRGVIEEKTNRIVEVMISSVRPFQLMMGKIIGIALVALTQFGLWIILSLILILVVTPVLLPMSGMDVMQQMAQPENSMMMQQQGNVSPEMAGIMNGLFHLPVFWLIFAFLFYFTGGYLLYASLFGAIGAAVDNDTDTQQFMLPVSLPLVLGFIVMPATIMSPDGTIAQIFSIIPFTSPVVMMTRLGFGVPDTVPYWELALSMILLVLTFIGTTALAAKIYRTGILLYGKKITYREIWRWLRNAER